MHKALVWTLLVYAGLKAAGLVLARSPGFRRIDLSIGERLRAGEPYLLLAAVLTAAPVALLTDWYSRRHFEQMFEKSTACFALVTVLQDRPEVRTGVSSYAIYESLLGSRNLSFDAAAHLAMPRADAQRILDAKTASLAHLAASKGSSSTALMGDEIVAGRRCLLPPAPGPNE